MANYSIAQILVMEPGVSRSAAAAHRWMEAADASSRCGGCVPGHGALGGLPGWRGAHNVP